MTISTAHTSASSVTEAARPRGRLLQSTRSLRLVTVAAVSLGSLAWGAPAQATFPGDNGRIVIQVDTSNTGDGELRVFNLVTMNPAGHGRQQLTDLPDGTYAQRPFWSPSGDTIVFDLFKRDARLPTQVWRINSDGSGMHRLVSDPNFNDQEASYSPDGSSVIFSRCNFEVPTCGIARVDADGSNLKMLTRLSTGDPKLDRAAAYSPDGEQIAFWRTTCPEGCNALYVMRSDGTRVHRITPLGVGSPDLDWAPNGQHLIFGYHDAIWRSDNDGSNLVRLTHPGDQHDLFPSYSPDGLHISFERDSADYSFFTTVVMRASGIGVHAIGPAFGGIPSWGPAS